MRRRKIFRFLGFLLLAVVVLGVALVVYVRIVSRVAVPEVPVVAIVNQERMEVEKNFYTLGNNWFRKSESGLYELYVEGEPFERGVANGKLTQELVQYQEEVFNRQIHQLVPSDVYLSVLKYFVGWFNRDLDKHVPEEYKQEIYGIAQSASHEFDAIAPPYQRMLNYHAAHDIGHALQNMALVGCTSFATWASRSEDHSLIIGRNFDFYVGDEFARDKIVAFYNPSSGYKFMMVTFGGMTGVLSGMNDQGLTVTLNAAKSEIPTASATPVSIVAREILQYAATIDEAYAIAAKRKMFVSESFLIGSAKDGRASLIEKSPEDIDRYDSQEDYIISTNHFQGKDLGQQDVNIEHINNSASRYRYERVDELLRKNIKNSVTKTAGLLRNRLGVMDTNIGLGNEKSVNQLIAHHAVIFQPEKKLVWVSTAPWQLGKFVCYDLNVVFSNRLPSNSEIYEDDRTIAADSFLLDERYPGYLKFSRYRFPFQSRSDLNPDSIVHWNPDSYHAYMLAGDYFYEHEEYAKAIPVYERGLEKEIATQQERLHMLKNIQHCKDKLK
ncbi:MAG: hypothetical protein JNM57_13455 [Cyclobacteriaceae bacterium]|nr:hypothetical protein [Cyclobacteriaceae bacterium]